MEHDVRLMNKRQVRQERYREKYRKRMHKMIANPKRGRILHFMNRLMTGIVVIAYPLLLGHLLGTGDMRLSYALIIPLDGFIVLSVFRYLINRRRPYETFGVGPAIPKDTKGKSFQSRHVFSATVIDMTYLFLYPWYIVRRAGGIMLFAADLINECFESKIYSSF